MKSILPRIVALAALGLAFASPIRAADSPSVLLQKGIYAEETEGNLDAAIKLYEQIASEAAATRGIVAQAQYRLALCYQKKGNKEQAINVLEEIVQQSPADADTAKKARDVLVQLGAVPTGNISVQKISLPFASAWFMSISPDGRYLAYQPMHADGFAVYELRTGKTWNIIKGAKAQELWSTPMFSADSQQVIYELNGSALYVAKVDGSETRKLWDSGGKEEEGIYVLVCPDDDPRLLTGIPGSTKNHFLAFNLMTGARSEIERLGDPEHVAAAPKVDNSWEFSRNGRYCARRIGDYPKGISILDSVTGHEEIAVKENAVAVFGWTPGDSRLLYSATRGGGMDLWALATKDGKVVGDPVLIWNNLDSVWPVGITRDANIYYSVWKGQDQPRELWVMDGFLSRITTAPQGQTIPAEEILGSGHSISDRKQGVAFTYPAGWVIRDANRGGKHAQTSSIQLRVPDSSGVTAYVFYRLQPDPKTPPLDDDDRPLLRQVNAEIPKPNSNEAIDSWLRRFTQLAADLRMRSGNQSASFYSGFVNNPETFQFRTINGHRSISWSTGFTRNGVDKDWKEYRTRIYTESVFVEFVILGPAEKVNELRLTFDRMVATFHSPDEAVPPTTSTSDIVYGSDDKIVYGPERAVTDENWGLSFTLPKEWTIVRAARPSATFSFLGFDAPGAPGVWLQIGYWQKNKTDNELIRQLRAEFPKPVTAEEVNAWLKRFVQLKTENRMRSEKDFPNYKLRADSLVPRLIGGRPAMSYLCDYKNQDGNPCVEYVTVIYGENLVVQAFILARQERVDAARSAYDALIESIHSS